MSLSAAAAPAGPASLFHVAQASIAAPTLVWSKLVDTGGDLAINLAVAAVTLAVTIWAAGWTAKLTRRAFGRIGARHRPDAMLQTFAASLARNVVLIVGFIAVLQHLGFRTTSIVAVLGAVSLAIGLALQGALSNVASGVLILLFRPFRVGDRVCIAGKQGTVRALEWFTTEIADPDNVRVIVPNGKVFGDVIVNYTRHENRRVELDFRIDFDDDVDLALGLLVEAAAADPRVLKTPEPWAKLTRIGDSALTVTLRAWMSPADYWDGRFDLLKAVRGRLAAADLHTPYPHQVGLTRQEVAPAPAVDAAAAAEVAAQPPSA
ncbi:MAG TPA: mechanosensitive ion channel family protein [Caulobacteraceae bacterium]